MDSALQKMIGTHFHNWFGAILSELEGKTLGGVELTRKEMALLLGCSYDTCGNYIGGRTRAGEDVIATFFANFPREATQLAASYLDSLRRKPEAGANPLHELANMNTRLATIAHAVIDASRDGVFDVGEKLNIRAALAGLRTVIDSMDRTLDGGNVRLRA